MPFTVLFGDIPEPWTVKRHNKRNADLWGWADHTNRVISLHRSLKGRKLLDTALHEGLHAAAPFLDEALVDRMARQLVPLLEALDLVKL